MNRDIALRHVGTVVPTEGRIAATIAAARRQYSASPHSSAAAP